MKRFLVPAVALLIAVVLVALSQFVLAIGFGALGVVWLAAAQFSASSRERSDSLDDLSSAARTKMLPLRRAVEQIERLANGAEGDDSVRIVARDALKEAQHIRSQVSAMMSRWDDLVRLQKDRAMAETDLAALQTKAVADADPDLQAAIEARKSELAGYDLANSQCEQLLAHAQQAESAVIQLAANLSRAVTETRATPTEDDALRENLLSLKALEAALDEVQQTETHP